MSPKLLRGVAGVLCVTVLGLLTFGFVMLSSASSFDGYRGDAYYFAKRQAMWVGLALAACAAAACVDYRKYRKLGWPLFFLAAALLIGVLIFGKRINGALRWYVYGPFRFQPSELAKYALVIMLAFWLEKIHRTAKGELRPKIQHWWWGVFAPISISGVLAGLILIEPDLGTALLLAAVTLLLMWVAGAPSRWLRAILGTGVGGAVAGFAAIFKYGMFRDFYQVKRLIEWVEWKDMLGSNYQQFISTVALGSGGVWGDGLGNSRMKMFLPEAHTDFILPIIGEELGLVATFAVVVALGVLIICGILIVRRAPDLFGLLLGSGIIAAIGLQAIINIAVVTNCIPNKGMPLPFISYGGSNLVMTLGAIGILLNISFHAYTRAMPTFTEVVKGAGARDLSVLVGRISPSAISKHSSP